MALTRTSLRSSRWFQELSAHSRRAPLLPSTRWQSTNSRQPESRSSPAGNDSTTHFGYETIAESLKESRVGAVFSSVASSYDTMNDLMSLGIHRLWKDHFVRNIDPGFKYLRGSSRPEPGWNILDVAGGTGDIAFRMLDHATHINGDHQTRVTVADINVDMLNEGRGNAEDMPNVPSSSIDLYTVAFGIRNFTSKEAALREAFRVLKPGGVFACLEFSKIQSDDSASSTLPFAVDEIPTRALDAVYKRWSFSAIPLIGQLVAGDRDSYQYLVESIDRFPSQQRFASMIKDAGFVIPETHGEASSQGWENLTGGIAAIHKGVKPL